MDDFADLTALGFASPRVETTPMELRKTSRPVVTSDGFNGNILPLAMVPGFSDDFQLVFGIPFMTTVGEESIFANEEGIFVRKGLILERQQPVFVEFPAPVRVHYHYPWAPDSALRTHFENQVPMPGNIFGVRLAEWPS